MIDFIYFDLGNVIFDFDHEKGCEQVAKLAKIPASDVQSAIFGTGLDMEYETGLINSTEFHLRFCEIASCQLSKSEFLYAASDIFRPHLAIFPLLTQLVAVNFPIGLLSNTCESHWEFLVSRYSILRRFFAPVILSYEVNSMKPNSEIYVRAVAMADCAAGRCFFVDDRIENVTGAISNGLDAVLFRTVDELIVDLEKRGVSINL